MSSSQKKKKKKKDKLGKKFGFVRFSRVGDEEKMLEDLNKIWIGSFIIRAYKPRFDRPMEGRSGENRKRMAGGCERVMTEIRRDASMRREGVKFSEILSRKDKAAARGGKVRELEIEGEDSFTFQSTVDESSWLREALTGWLKREFSWREHGEELKAECAMKLKLTYMGNNFVLIQSEKGGRLKMW